jgi:hypothetical protein
VSELLRVNAELAAEIRRLAIDREGAPRSGAGTSARRLSRLVSERDALIRERDALLEERDAVRDELGRTIGHRDELAAENVARAKHIDEMGAELARLRSGFGGLVLRALARRSRRRAGG